MAQVACLFFALERALSLFLSKHEYAALGPSKNPAEVAFIPGALHQRLCTRSALLRRMNADLSTDLIAQIRNKIALFWDLTALEALAHAWWCRLPNDLTPDDLRCYSDDLLLESALSFLTLSAKERIALLSGPYLALHWTKPVVEATTTRILD